MVFNLWFVFFIIFFQRKKGTINEQLTLTEWIQSIQSAAPSQNLTVLVVGLSKYFRFFVCFFLKKIFVYSFTSVFLAL